MPAGTGVWVVKTVEARETSSAVSQSSPGPPAPTVSSRDPLEAEEAGVALVGVEDLGGRVAGDAGVDAERAHAADAEKQLLAQAVLLLAAVQPVGHLAVVVGVALDVGVEQQQRHAADAGDPDAGEQVRAARHLDRDRWRGSPFGLTQQGERQLVGVEDRVGLLLPALAGQRLLEVAALVEQAHADERHAEVRGGLQVVAGEDAEAAGVLREHGGDAELRREVPDRAGRVVAGLALVPAVGGQVAVEVGLGGVQPLDEAVVLGQLAPPLAADRAEQADRVVAHGVPGPGRPRRRRPGSAGCQDHRRLPASAASGSRAGGRTGRTVNRRIARTAGR